MTAEIVRLRRHDFQEGDAVRLRSGGPIMLVAVADGEIISELLCVWVSGRRLQTGSFHFATVELVAAGALGQ